MKITGLSHLFKWENLHNWWLTKYFFAPLYILASSHITLQPETGCPLKLSRVGPGQYLDGRLPEKTRLLLEEVLVWPAGGAHPAVCVGPV